METRTPPITSGVWLTVAMTLLYVTALGCRMTGTEAHEWIGLIFCILCILHVGINRRWLTNISKGRYTFRRQANTLLNMLLPIAVGVLCVTGILISRHMFRFLDVKGSMDARQLHTFAAYWGLVLLGIHLGLQWMKVLAGLKNAPGIATIVALSSVRLCLLLLSVAYGVWASFDRAMGSKLFLGFSFDFWDSSRPELLFYTHTLAVLALYVTVTHYTLTRLVKNAVVTRSAAATETTRI